MSSSDPKENTTATAIAEVAKSKAGEKLMEAVKGLVQLPHNIVDYIAGAKRITEVNAARVGVSSSKLGPMLKSSACGRRLPSSFSTGKCTRL